MSLSFVLNDSTPSPAPTNGCCAGVADISGAVSPQKISMRLNGAVGSGTTTLNFVSSTNNTYLYYIGTSGDLDGQTIGAGSWSVPVNVSTAASTVTVKSVYICRANSSGTSLGTIGNSTGLSTNLTAGVHTFTVTGSQTTFATGDVVIVSFQMGASGTGNVLLTHDQTVTAPATVASTGIVWPRALRFDEEPLPGVVYQTRLPPFLKPVAGPVPPPRILRFDEEPFPGLVLSARPPIPPFAPLHPLQPVIVRFDEESFPGAIFRSPLMAPPVPGPVPPPQVVRFDEEPFPGAIFKTPVMPVINPARIAGGVPPPRVYRFDEEPFAGAIFKSVIPPPGATAQPGVLILFYRGPKADLPILKKGEPGWCTDTNQLFVGDGFTNHFVGGMASLVPAHTSSPGYPGEYACDGTNYYICYALNSWAKVGVSPAF